jgi:hypothetical protein
MPLLRQGFDGRHAVRALCFRKRGGTGFVMFGGGVKCRAGETNKKQKKGCGARGIFPRSDAHCPTPTVPGRLPKNTVFLSPERSVVESLAKSSCIKNSRVIVEKPFGHDLASAQQLNGALHAVLPESRILFWPWSPHWAALRRYP